MNSASQNRSKISDHHRTLSEPTAGVEVDLVADFGDPGPATLMRRLRGAVGAVEVGEHLPPSHGDAELVMRQLGGVVDHHLGHVHQLRAAARVGERPPQLMGLGDTDLTATHGIGEPVTAGDQVGGADPIPTLGIGPASQRPTPAVDVAVPIPARAHRVR